MAAPVQTYLKSRQLLGICGGRARASEKEADLLKNGKTHFPCFFTRQCAVPGPDKKARAVPVA